jgi:hypothetical protein
LIGQFLKATSSQNLTLAYSSQENAIVERNNKEINRHLQALTFDKNTVYDYQQLLPFVQRILNSSYNGNKTTIFRANIVENRGTCILFFHFYSGAARPQRANLELLFGAPPAG